MTKSLFLNFLFQNERWEEGFTVFNFAYFKLKIFAISPTIAFKVVLKPFLLQWFIKEAWTLVFQQVTVACTLLHTAISRNVVGKNVHVTTPKGNMGYDQYIVSDT